jgi:hypothetical protein
MFTKTQITTSIFDKLSSVFYLLAVMQNIYTAQHPRIMALGFAVPTLLRVFVLVQLKQAWYQAISFTMKDSIFAIM